MMSSLAQTLEIPNQSVTKQVYRALYSAIITIELAPGARISEAEIAKKLGVSRQPVRDAFYRLSEIGFLLIRPQRPTTITYISERALLDARFVRTALEIECLFQTIDRISAEQIEVLDKLLAKQEAAISNGDNLEFHELDDLFHRRLVEFSGHSNVWDLVKDQKVHLDRVRFLSLKTGTGAKLAYDEHREIVRLIQCKDALAAEKIYRKHLSNILGILSVVRDADPKYFVD